MGASFLAVSYAFSPSTIQPRPFTKLISKSDTALNGAVRAETEEDAMYLILQARECAHSDTCSIDQADAYLNQVVHIQGGCAAGTLSGLDICQDISFVSEVVADLREKINSQSKLLSNSEKAKLIFSNDTASSSIHWSFAFDSGNRYSHSECRQWRCSLYCTRMVVGFKRWISKQHGHALFTKWRSLSGC